MVEQDQPTLGVLRSLPMSLRGAAFIAGAFEHPRRDIPDRTVAQIHAEVAIGALRGRGTDVRRRRRLLLRGTTRRDTAGAGSRWPSIWACAISPDMDSTEKPAGPRSDLPRVARGGGDRGRASATSRSSRSRASRGTAASQPGGGRTGPAGRTPSKARCSASPGLVSPPPLRAVGPPAHVRVRHDERAARRDQGGGDEARRPQPERLPAEGDDGRGRRQLAARRGPAAPGRLLPGDRRRRRRGRGEP